MNRNNKLAADQLKTNLQDKFGFNDRELGYDGLFHTSSYKFLDLIFESMRPALEADLSLEWMKKLYGAKGFKSLDQWMSENFLPPLSVGINKLLNEERNYTLIGLENALRQMRNRIYRGIVSYLIDTAQQSHILLITPWDIVNMLMDDEGQSLIRLIQFSSRNIDVTFTANGTKLPSIYNLSLDQFMGMTLASMFLPQLTIIVNIFGLETEISSFLGRLASYNIKYDEERHTYSLVATRGVAIKRLDDGQYKIFKFDTIDFISGFVTPFSWIGEDHHKYWTEFRQFDNPTYPEGQVSTF